MKQLLIGILTLFLFVSLVGAKVSVPIEPVGGTESGTEESGDGPDPPSNPGDLGGGEPGDNPDLDGVKHETKRLGFAMTRPDIVEATWQQYLKLIGDVGASTQELSWPDWIHDRFVRYIKDDRYYDDDVSE